MRRAAAFPAALLAVVFACALMAGSASAASYSVYSCAGPSGESLPNDAWIPHLSNPGHADAYVFGSSCSDLGVVVAAGSGMAAGENGGLLFTAPAGTLITGYLVHRSANIAFYSNTANPTLSAGLRRTVNAADSYSGECEAQSAPCAINPTGTQSAGLTASSLQLGVECAQTSTSCPGGKITTLNAKMTDARVDLKDGTAPVVVRTGGSLDSGATGTSRTLSILATDTGGGVQSVSLAIDGTSISTAHSGGSCSQPFTKPVPCPPSDPLTFAFNIASLSAGLHTAVVAATDAAGNTGTLAPVNFTIGSDGGVTGSGAGGNGSPATERPSLVVIKSVIQAAASKSVTVGGILRTSSGEPIVDARLEVAAAQLGLSTSATSLGTLQTGDDGHFELKVKPSGAQRITFSYRPRAGSEPTAEASTIVREPLALSAKGSRATLSYGGTFTIAGRLKGAGAAAGGAPVEIDVGVGRRWAAVGSVTATKGGAYTWRHRFTKVTRPTIFRFRVVVRASKSWPWPTKSSGAIRVLVR